MKILFAPVKEKKAAAKKRPEFDTVSKEKKIYFIRSSQMWMFGVNNQK